MKKAIALCVSALLCLGLASCAGNSGADDSKSGLQEIKVDIKDVNKDKTSGNNSADGIAADDVIIRSDAENLVEVRIENGEASVTLNAARFDELYDYSNRYESEIYTGTIKIVGNSGKIKDACIAQIAELDYINGTDFTAPTVFLLMENRTVEHVFVDLLPHDFQVAELQSSGPLMWIKDIAALYCESDGEGFGEMTVFAEGENGARYDLRIPVSFSELYSGAWVCDIGSAEGYYTDGYYGVLNFEEGGTAAFEKGWIGESNRARYTGTFDLTITENSGMRPGMMTLDLLLDPASYTDGAPKEIHGTYFAEATNLISLSLWHIYGDNLHSDDEPSVISWDFELGYNPLGDNYYNPYIHDGEAAFDSYTEYLLFTIDSVREMVESNGMAILDTGEYVELDGGYYRLVSLGINHPDYFSREIHYAISSDGVIYEYDVILDEWTVIWVPD